MQTIIAFILALLMTAQPQAVSPVSLLGQEISQVPQATQAQSGVQILASRQMSLETRYKTASVNEVMKKNILLNLAYLRGTVTSKQDINWDQVVSPFTYQISLAPGETFAYHDTVLPEYQGRVKVTTNTRFNAQDGYLSDGYLYGDGVCHLASLINWAAQDAGLDVLVTKNHDFATIPEVPREYGVSIYVNKSSGAGARNNLYITNTKSHEVQLNFSYQADGQLQVSVTANALVASR